MAKDAETTIRESLDAVDRHRKRMFAGFVAVVVVMTVGWFRFGPSAGDVPKMLTVTLFVLMLWTSAMAVAVIVQMTRMTKMILRAIDLASKPLR
jgi:hypothetical protein